MDIAALRSLVPSCPPVLYYCHESQISYPQPNANPGDLHFAFTDLVNMLSSALVVFNSRSHRSTYLDRLPQFLNSLPEFRPMWAVEEIANRSTVCYPGIDIAGPADASPAADNSGGRHRPPLVIWNHRWEFDKNPAVFFRALDEVADRGVQFEVAILGENFKTVPEEFTRARARLGKRVIHYGYAADRDVYRDWLARGTVVVSSAIQENFGISVLEAIAHGCAPVLPRRLSYPELIPSEFHDDTFYDTGSPAMAERRRGPEGFDIHYRDLYGGRWDAIRTAMQGEPEYARLEACLVKPFFLDPASVAVAVALEVSPGHEVLDMCAAPGGKTLVLACRLEGTGSLVANERSSARRARLHRVLAEHLSPADRASIRVTGHDASRWGLYEPNRYDRILADVPCSSERHVLNAPAALRQWSDSRTRRLAQAAYAIACAAVDSLKPGGVAVYSTCALSPGENDGVVGRLLERSRGLIQIQREWLPSAHPDRTPILWETTEFGWTAMPDRNSGAGPMYFARLCK
jgi:hypothetical protein